MEKDRYGKIVDFVHMLINTSYGGKKNLQIVDATCGNGFDTLFLCKIAGTTGHVAAFDIQNQAIERTRSLLESSINYNNYDIIKDSHEKINIYTKDKIDIAIFNLGYLPFSDKKITTNPDITCSAIKNLLPLLNNDGRIFITTYIYHDNGQEINKINSFLKKLNKSKYNVINIKLINKENYPPELFIIEKNA